MKRLLVILILTFGLLLASCSGTSSSEDSGVGAGVKVPVGDGAYANISVAELQTMLEDKDFPLINVHIPFEGDLPDTDASIPFNEIASYLDQLPEDKDARIVLYCRSGRMSSIAAEVLVDQGYTNVYNLAGGFNAWEGAGLPVVGR